MGKFTLCVAFILICVCLLGFCSYSSYQRMVIIMGLTSCEQLLSTIFISLSDG